MTKKSGVATFVVFAALCGCAGLLNLPAQLANRNAAKAGEGSRTLRLMAGAHAAKPEITAFRFELGKGGDAGWKALGLPEDFDYHSFEGWVVGTGLWMVATGNLDSDAPFDEWEWSPAVPSPMQLREDWRNEWEHGYYLSYTNDPKPGPSMTHEQRMEIARRRGIYDASLSNRFELERRYSAMVRTDGKQALEIARDLDGDACLDRWQIVYPDGSAKHVADDLDDRGCAPR